MFSTLMRPQPRQTFWCAVGDLNAFFGGKMDYWVVQKSKWIGVFLVSLLLLGQTKPVAAQSQKGAISGVVTDQAGAVLKGAEVSIESQDVRVVTNEEGNFVITGLD